VAARDPTSTAARRRHLVRLSGLAATLTGLLAVFAVGGVLGTAEIRGWIEPLGAGGPLAYVLLAGALGAVLVPGAVLAAVSGLLFGAVAGALLAVPAAVLSAVLARQLSATAGGVALDELSGPRLRALVAFARRNGLLAVIVQRLLPAVPDGPLSHAFGLARVRARDVALGTAIASGPRALSYALLGSSADDLTGPDAVAGVALNVATGGTGLLLAWVVVRRERRRGTADGGGPGSSPNEPGPPVIGSGRMRP